MGRRFDARQLRLFALLQLAALVPLVGVGVSLDRATVQQKTQETLRDGRTQAELIVQTALEPRFERTGLVSADAASVQSALAPTLTSPAVQAYADRVKLWDTTGRVLASDDPALVGRTFPLDDDLAEALHGEESASVTHLENAENVDDKNLGSKAIEVYDPVRDESGRVVGAFEMYLPYAPLASALDHEQLTLQRDLAIGLVAVFGLLSFATWPVLRRLRRNAEEAEAALLVDATTGLPNRLGLEAELERLVAAGEPFLLAAGDVHGLGQVNEALGYEGGDALLRHIGAVLSDDGRLAARIGGDEFAVVVEGPAGEGTLSRLREATSQETEVAGVPVAPLLSFGAARFPTHATTGRALLAMATSAQVAAERLPGGVATYDPANDPFDADALRLLSELRHGIAADQLRLVYQPQVRATDGVPVGVEALVRWQHPERGLLTPDVFLPMAEKTGLVTEITRWVLRAASLQASTWRRLGAAAVVSVNISARDLGDPEFAVAAAAAVSAGGAHPAWLCLELTETALVEDPVGARRVLEQLAEAGFRLSLDDFGMGFTSLSQLRDLPLDEIKLDRTFVAGMGDNDADAAIVASVADLARNLRLTVVAEGVETAEQQEALAHKGFHVVQGWHTGRPQPPDVLTPRLLLPSQSTGTAVPGPFVLPNR